MSLGDRNMDTPEVFHAVRAPARLGESGFDRELEAQWAEQLRDARRAFAALVLRLPSVYREFVLDGDPDGPLLGHHWPVKYLEACFRRMSRCAPVQDDPESARIISEARGQKEKIDRARQALILANLRLAIRVGKSLNGREIEKLKQQLAAVSLPAGHGTLEADDVREILQYVVRSENRNPRERALREDVVEALSSLTPRQEKVIRLRFGIGLEADHTLEQIGAVLGLSRDTVRRLEQSARWKLGTTRELLDLDRYLIEGRCE